MMMCKRFFIIWDDVRQWAISNRQLEMSNEEQKIEIFNDKKIILFDGVCNLCSSSVQFVLKRDNKNQFLFGSLQGNYGQTVLKKNQLPTDSFNSFMLLEGEKLYTRSSGALRMLKYLGSGWSLLYAFIIVPKFIRDAVYNTIAKNRYKWFGKKEECWIPTPAYKAKFLD
jgi:predicted DCC family thiol-disulfide oxidoreductase YuxK